MLDVAAGISRVAGDDDEVRDLPDLDAADGVAEADVFALFSEGGQACVQVFFYRGGQNWGGRAYFPRVDRADTDPEILAAFLGQFYEDKPIPRLMLNGKGISPAAGLPAMAGRRVR